MKLDDFIKRALETGHSRYRLTSVARGVEIACGTLAEARAEDLMSLAADDATPLSRDGLHDYALVVESEDGAKRTRMAIRVHGGKASESEHAVDVDRVQSSGAVIGHLVKLLVAKDHAIMTMVNKVIDRDMVDAKELGKLRRSQAHRGEFELVKVQLERDAQESRDERAQRSNLISQLVELGKPLLLRALPGGPATALQKFRASLTAEQSEAICIVVGASTFARLMTLDDPSAVATLLIEEVGRETGQKLFAVLNSDQQAILGAALSAEMQKRKAAEAPAAAANGAPS